MAIVRVFDFSIEGTEPVKLARMSEGMVKIYIEKVQGMVQNAATLPKDAWVNHRNDTIEESLKRAAAAEGVNGSDALTVEKLDADIDYLDQMFYAILRKSNIKAPDPAGEGKADSISADSKAA